MILVKVSISLQSEFDPEGAETLICGDLQPGAPLNLVGDGTESTSDFQPREEEENQRSEHPIKDIII